MTLQEKITAILEEATRRGECAGVSVLLRRDGEEQLYAESGYADLETRAPIRRDSIFRLYSQSKPITAAAVMLLMERGEIDLMDGVDQYLPGFKHCRVAAPGGSKPALRAPTLLELLSMTSGLYYPSPEEGCLPAVPLFAENERLIDEGRGMTTQEFCNRIGQLPLLFQPGEHFRYGTSADVLGAVVEVASGRRFGDFLREEFFEPLGMKDTAFYVPEEKRDRFVTAYDLTDGRLTPWKTQHLAVGRYNVPPAFESGGAGLTSTLDDYAAFADMLLHGGSYRGRRILSPQTVRYMTAPQLTDQQQKEMWENLSGFSYGKLMRVCVRPGQTPGLSRLGEYGWDGWQGTYFANFPNERMTLLLMMNRTGAGTAAVTRKVRNAILAEIE